jgi:hypothetical protein
MAAGKTTTQEAAVLNVLRATNITAPATAYVGLFTAAPTDAGGGTEVSGNAYARQACGFSAPTGTTPSTITNAADILFPVNTPAGWGTIVAFGIFSALTAGTLLYWNTLTNKTFAANDQAVFRAGALTVTED